MKGYFDFDSDFADYGTLYRVGATAEGQIPFERDPQFQALWGDMARVFNELMFHFSDLLRGELVPE